VTRTITPASELGKRRYNLGLLTQQYSLGSHCDSTEMAAAISERFTDDREFRFWQTFSQIGAQLFAPNRRRSRSEIVLLIHFPPRIEYRARRRPFKQSQKVVQLVMGHPFN
jgi:hypothetical protein